MSLSKPVSKTELKQYILTKLGSPVIEINLASEQLDLAVQDTFDFFTEYHVDGMEHKFIAHQVRQEDIDNRWIPVPVRVSGVTSVFRPRNRTFGLTGENLFNIEYYLYRNEIFELSTNQGGLSSYYITMQQISMMDDLLNFDLHYRFTKTTNRLYVDTNWVKSLPLDSFLVFECYEEIDPDEYPEMYSHWVVKDLSVAMAKKQWASNLLKFQGVALPGGVTLNGSELYEQAEREIEAIKNDFILKYQAPDNFLIG